MRGRLVVALVAAPALLGAQRVTVFGTGRAAALVDSVVARPHTVRRGSGPLVLPRDSTITSSLVVFGRPTYLASTVRGDVVVVGGDLFLRPGVAISGRAISIGGTVTQTSLGTVAGGVESLRDDSFLVRGEPERGDVTVTEQVRRVAADSIRLFQLAGIHGLLVPRYDRVDGLSLPVGVQLTLAEGAMIVQPSVTYRSRLGAFDPGVSLRIGSDSGRRLEGRVARETRSNDLWITSELINSLKTLAFGTDTRNYFRSDIGELRGFVPFGGQRALIEPFVGARFENISSISATGDVFSFLEKSDSEKIRRPNPTVEPGHIASALVGAVYTSLPTDAPVSSRLFVEVEQAFTTPSGTRNFTQFTADGRVEFPTFGRQRLRVRGHAVGTVGDSVPRSRYAYLGGSRTLGLSDLLQYGGTDLVFVESRYLVPFERILLPVVGSPVFSLIHRIGGAGVGSLGTVLQEVGVGVSVGPIDFEVITGASGQHRSDFGVGVSLPAF